MWLEEEASTCLEEEASACLEEETMVEEDAMFSLVDAQEDAEPSEFERVRDEPSEEDSAVSSSSL